MLDAVGTPGAGIPEFNENDIFLVTTAVLTFDNKDNADKGLDAAADAYAAEMVDTASAAPREIDDLGDKATLYSGETADAEGGMVPANLLIVRDAERMYMIMLMGGETEVGATQVQDIARFTLDAEPTTDEVTFNMDGSSTGGPFDRMPTAQDTDLIGGLSPFIDMDMSEDIPETGF